jgi:hypothetical protein
VLIVGPSEFTPLFERRAAEAGTRVVVAEGEEADAAAGPAGQWLRDDLAVALAVTRELGIDDEGARRGFERAPSDPGAARHGRATLGGGETDWLDATAANDPDSLELLLRDFAPWRAGGAGRPRILVYHHRDDRGPRLECFARHSAALAACDHLVVSGARPPRVSWHRLAAVRSADRLSFVATRDLPRWLARREPSVVAFCGNTRGVDVPRLLEEAATCD